MVKRFFRLFAFFQAWVSLRRLRERLTCNEVKWGLKGGFGEKESPSVVLLALSFYILLLPSFELARGSTKKCRPMVRRPYLRWIISIPFLRASLKCAVSADLRLFRVTLRSSTWPLGCRLSAPRGLLPSFSSHPCVESLMLEASLKNSGYLYANQVFRLSPSWREIPSGPISLESRVVAYQIWS